MRDDRLTVVGLILTLPINCC